MNAAERQAVIYMLKGCIAELPHGEQQTVNSAIEEIRAAVAKAGPFGVVALALVGAEMEAR